MALDLERISNEANNRFDTEEFKSYLNKMSTLHEIMRNLRNLSHESSQIIFSRKDEGQEYAKYFNDQNIINNKKNNEYIKSMLRYVVKQQKELVDDMYSKLEVDLIDESDEVNISEITEIDENKIDENKIDDN